MIGLLWKDIFVARKTLKFYTLFLMGYWILSVLGIFDPIFVTSFSMVLFITLPLSAFAYDEQVKWMQYVRTLPLSPAQIVGARYLLILLLTAVAFALNATASILMSPKNGQDLMFTLVSLLTAMGFGFFIIDFMLPLSYKLGVERTKPFLFGLVFLPIIGLFLLYKLGLFDQLELSFLDRLPPAGVLICCALITLLNILGLLLSFWISCRIFSRTDF